MKRDHIQIILGIICTIVGLIILLNAKSSYNPNVKQITKDVIFQAMGGISLSLLGIILLVRKLK